MKNCTNHFLERWVERIVGIEDKNERKMYIAQNRDMIIEHANKTFGYADFLYCGQIGSNITRHYYIKDDIVFVTNTTDDALITVYKVDLGFPEHLNAIVRKSLQEEVRKLTAEKEEIEASIARDVAAKEEEMSKTDELIRIMELQLTDLKKKKEFLKQEIDHIKTRSRQVDLEIQKYVLMLVNSLEYKRDLQEMR